jgi:hypothetical protein
MKRWAHPQDVIGLGVGVYALLAPIWTATTGKATATMIVLGVLTAGLALVSLARPGLVAEGLLALMGALFVISPWVMSFHGTQSMAWTAWIVGGVAFLVGVSDISLTRMSHHGGGLAASH